MSLYRSLTYVALLLLTFFSGTVSRPPADELKKRQAELQSIREQIRQLEAKLEEQQKSEKATLDLLDTYDKKATLVRRLITRLRQAETEYQDGIVATRSEIKKLELRLDFLKTHYARYVASVYKAGQLNDIELLLASRSINQLYVRAEYLRRFSEQRKSDIGKIQANKNQIEEKQAQLQEQLSDQRHLIAEKGAEEDRLVMLVADRRDVLQKIRKDRKNAQRELERRLQSVQELEKLITHLIEQERIKKERAGKLPQPPAIAGAFESKKGRLRWPVNEGAVVARFGNQRHPTLKTITQNTGIDISVKSGTPVSTVADGEVATIWWLPSYGNIVIVDHYGGYRTVYSHLAEIRVTQGQKVKEGESIGTSGESLDGPRLHFELWKERDKQNPELWLGSQ